jgi:DNA-binding LacI/PurR family transcriptional regulator
LGTSITDVAKLAGVSRATVSHTISGHRFVGQDVRDRVLAAMDELGYVPSRSARNLALGTTQVIGLLVPDIANGFFAELAKGVETTAIEAGYNVIIGNTGFNREREILYLEMIRSRAVDGILYAAGSAVDNSQLAKTIADIPLVMVDEEPADSATYSIISDNYDGGRQVAEYLLSLGHVNALVLGAQADLLSSSRRVDGFTDAWNAGSGDVAVELGSFTFQGGHTAVSKHLDSLLAGNVTAIFAANDLMALGAISCLRNQGMRTPEDVSIVGFDDSPLAQYTFPRLTTVRQDVWGLGVRAATVLLDALRAKTPLGTNREVQDVQLIIGQTSGPPPGVRRPRGFN